MNTFENIMENGKEQMLHFSYYFQIHDISKVPKGVIMELRVKISNGIFRTYCINMFGRIHQYEKR